VKLAQPRLHIATPVANRRSDSHELRSRAQGSPTPHRRNAEEGGGVADVLLGLLVLDAEEFQDALVTSDFGVAGFGGDVGVETSGCLSWPYRSMRPLRCWSTIKDQGMSK
jgi:hypothetical protein